MKKFLIITILIILMCVPVAGKGRTGIVERKGNLYFYRNGHMVTGWISYNGNRYYAHKTSSKKYPRGSLTQYQFRVCSNNRWYGFNHSGKMYKKDYYRSVGPTKKALVLKIRKNYTVQYVYTRKCWRYSTLELRYQYADVGNKYRTVEGMQFIPIGWVDWQK